MPKNTRTPINNTPVYDAPSPCQLFLGRWAGGCGSSLCAGARRLVFARGVVPCRVLFVGEGPGSSENATGRPFVGPAGHLLDHIVETAIPDDALRRQSCAYTNLVCCIPLDESGQKLTQPADADIKRCGPRLQEFVHLCDGGDGDPSSPSPGTLGLVVAVGTLARDWLDPKRGRSIKLHRTIPRVDIPHPAHILRSNVVQQSLMVQRCVVILSNALHGVLPPGA